jgi:glyoxylase-like metal-dependent hydrolase (beta-lactamase superfamily II)
MKEIFPSLFVIDSEEPDGKARFTYLIKRKAGNVLFATKADTPARHKEIAAAGKVAHMMLGDRHHAVPPTEALAKRLGVPLCCSSIEAAVLKKQGVNIAAPLPYEPAKLTHDIEIIPTPGHTRGAFSYLWTNAGRKFLFIGDTIVPVDGEWKYWVTKVNRAQMRKTMQALSKVSFDVILSNSFASTPVPWFEVDARSRAAIFKSLDRSLAD